MATLDNNQILYLIVFLSYVIYIFLRCGRRNGYWICDRRAAEAARQREQRNADAVAAFMQQNTGTGGRNSSSLRLAHNTSPEERKAFIMSCVVVDKAKNVLTFTSKDKNPKRFTLLSSRSSGSYDSNEPNGSNPATQENDQSNLGNTSNNTDMNIGSGDEENQRRENSNSNNNSNDSDSSSNKNNNSDNDADDSNNNSNNNNEKRGKANSPFVSIFTQLIKDAMLKEPPASSRSLNSGNDSTGNSDNVCPICIAEFEKDDDICMSRNRECPHIFHVDCMMEWLMNHDECPLCRQDYLSESNYVVEDNNTSTNNTGTNNSDGVEQSDGGGDSGHDGGSESSINIHTRLGRNASFRIDRSNSI